MAIQCFSFHLCNFLQPTKSPRARLPCNFFPRASIFDFCQFYTESSTHSRTCHDKTAAWITISNNIRGQSFFKRVTPLASVPFRWFGLAVGGWVTPSKIISLGFDLGAQASKSRLYFSEADAVAISERRKISEWVGG